MAPLTKSVQRECKAHTAKENVVPVNDDSIIYAGAIVMREAASGVVVPGADTASCVPLGVALQELDNTNGGDGSTDGLTAERCIRIDQDGEWEFAVNGGTPKTGQNALIFDDNTVSADATTNSLKIGTFTRPSPGGGWFVDISRR